MKNISYELLLLICEKLKVNILDNIIYSKLGDITSLEICGIDDLEGIQYLKNLRYLVIKSYDYSKMTWDAPIFGNPYINKISDFSLLNELDNLEYLEISNDMFIKELDISNLKNLKSLVITNNPSLEKIYGLDELSNLKEIIIYRNNIKQVLDMKKYIKNTMLSKVNVLDIDFYLNAVNSDNSISQDILSSVFKGETNIYFAEPSGVLDYTLTHPVQITEMYKKICSYFKREKVFEMSFDDKIYFVYSYILKHTKFNREELIDRNNRYLNTNNEDVEILKKNLTFLHNGYTTYYLKSGNCEGRINLMHFMLSILGIDSQNVHCVDRRSRELVSNHCIIRINDLNSYIDCSYNDASKNNDKLKFYLTSSDELSDTHILNVYEKLINANKEYSLKLGDRN